MKKDYPHHVSALPRVIFLAAIWLISFQCAFALDPDKGRGNVRGLVQTSDGQPAGFVNVSIKGSSKGALTGEQGEYLIRNVAEGAQTLVVQLVGYAAVEVAIQVLPDETITAPVVSLKENFNQLEEVQVKGNINRFADKETDYVARLPLKNLENPQVYSAVNKDLISEQVVTDFKDALRNVAGVAPVNNPAGGTGATIRGFSATTTVRNGMAVQIYQSDPINLERVEVIKGPSGTLFGSSLVSFGGLINQVTKKPFETFKGEVSYTAGSYELSRFTADVNTPLNAGKTLLLRVNAAAHSEGTWQTFGHNRRYTATPSLLYKVDDRLTLTFDAELNATNRSTVAYYQNLNKTSYTNFKDIPIGSKTSLGGENIDADLTALNYALGARYTINSKWTSQTNVTIGNNRIEHSNQIYPNWISDTTFNRNISNYGPRIFTSINAQQNFTGNFNIGRLRNRLLVGLDVYTFTSQLRFTDVGTYDVVSTNKPIPGINLDKVNAILATKTNSNNQTRLSTYSAYASDVINLTERLIVMLSVRIDRFVNNATITNGVKGANDYKQTAVSPKFGFVYQVAPEQLSIFGNYMNGFQNVAPVVQPDGSTSTFKPLNANQWEFGLKAEAFNRKLTGTVSYYDISINNATRVEDSFTIQDGQQKSKGYEFEVVANPVAGMNIVAGYAKNDNKVVKAAAFEGNYVAQVPTDYANVWISYKFTGKTLRNFGLGLGGNYVSDCYFEAANLITIPGYTLINASLFYDQPKWRVTLKGNNLANEVTYSNWGLPQPLRQLAGSVTIKF
ncbi:iron complex outermembrane recepter protein [Dyadobacter soli]|uniref:Iron complex outermembrane recepter protein n=1 Tax=Dyadobacter soli TaxID=659014 RepID=A0A1G7XMC1_9BACT|nr:TonB-dependent receptor [Dyadobacter soli]SDG85226.1 iron complex outermembrane recepter protein [Dyadobacter soli]